MIAQAHTFRLSASASNFSELTKALCQQYDRVAKTFMLFPITSELTRKQVWTCLFSVPTHQLHSIFHSPPQNISKADFTHSPPASKMRQNQLILCLILHFLLISASIDSEQNKKFVHFETLQGNVRGTIENARNGHLFYAFQGLPYARPPLGEFRWQAPQPAPKWEGTLDATKIPNLCAQDKLYEPAKLTGSEDCLYLNVFTGGKGML